MNYILYNLNKYKYFIILNIILILIIIFIVFNNEKPNNDEVINFEPVYEEVKSSIKVDVKGLVVNSGVVTLDSDSRVIDAIEACGGLMDGASTSYLNLSKKLKDGDVVIVYSNEYIESLKEDKTVYIELPCECPEKINDGCITDEIVNDMPSTNDTLISINKASKEELMTLPGIGESKADAIIKYREENRFNTLEDIMNVSGIGESAYSKIKDYIKL